MKALVTLGAGQVGFRPAEVPDPMTGDRDLLVEVRAASLNRGDLQHAAAAAGEIVRGYDFAGVVVRASPAGGPPVGSRVAGLVPAGAWAERVAAPVGSVAELPSGLSFADAAAVPVAGLTALYALRQAGQLLGRRVLVTGASGGVGGWAVQLAALGGASVIAVTRDLAKASALRDLGAAAVATPADLPAEPVDVVVDTAGGDSFTVAMARLGPGGIGICVGNPTRLPLALPAGFGEQRAAFRITWISVFDELTRAAGGRDLGYLLDRVAAGELSARAGHILSWTEVTRGLDYLSDSGGKVVFTFG
ncbi:zinc-binding dehydrogenase [Amycolatopsis jejuensis]|uniref:zinc-binding dehydrogenase n=1 Tax=Amycolatopsis jejuensis TaxID=330084 RepID=UPI00069222E0|nr:zinc-binding dehydrogenase [Amycolatopsis jejuensis]